MRMLASILELIFEFTECGRKWMVRPDSYTVWAIEVCFVVQLVFFEDSANNNITQRQRHTFQCLPTYVRPATTFLHSTEMHAIASQVKPNRMDIYRWRGFAEDPPH